MGPVILLATTSAIGALLLFIDSRMSVQRWVRWARAAANYGASDILNARRVDSDLAVSALRAQFEAWSAIVQQGTAGYCGDIDAHRVQFFDAPDVPDVRAYNDEHSYIRRMTAARVERLLDLASRVENGETQLRAYFVPRTEHA